MMRPRSQQKLETNLTKMNSKHTETFSRAIAKLKEYAAEDSITAERLNPLLEAMDRNDISKAKELRSDLCQYLACGHGIDELYDSLCQADAPNR